MPLEIVAKDPPRNPTAEPVFRPPCFQRQYISDMCAPVDLAHRTRTLKHRSTPQAAGAQCARYNYSDEGSAPLRMFRICGYSVANHMFALSVHSPSCGFGCTSRENLKRQSKQWRFRELAWPLLVSTLLGATEAAAMSRSRSPPTTGNRGDQICRI